MWFFIVWICNVCLQELAALKPQKVFQEIQVHQDHQVTFSSNFSFPI